MARMVATPTIALAHPSRAAPAEHHVWELPGEAGAICAHELFLGHQQEREQRTERRTEVMVSGVHLRGASCRSCALLRLPTVIVTPHIV
jgi:hypothetical protein